jgi:hypothetical protein
MNLETCNKEVRQEVLMLKHMISGKVGKKVDLSNLDGIFSQEAIDIYRKEEVRKSAMLELKKCL